MSTWRKSGLANYKKRHSELSKRFHIGWIYIYRGLLYSRVFATWIIYPRRLHWSTCKQREDVFPRSTHDPTFRWKENRMSVRNGQRLRMHGISLSFTRRNIERNIPFPTWKILLILHYFSFGFAFFLSLPFFFKFLINTHFLSNNFYRNCDSILANSILYFSNIPFLSNDCLLRQITHVLVHLRFYTIYHNIYIYIFRDVLFSRYELLL